MTRPAAPPYLLRRDALARLAGAHPELEMSVDVTAGQPVYVAKSLDHQTILTAGTVESLRSKIEGPLVEFEDAGTASIPRVYDYWLGGKSNFEADRVLAARIEQVYPGTPGMVMDNRQFLGRAIRYVVSQGIRQVVDIGAGLPTSPAVHEIARAAASGTRVAYIDNEVMVIRHYQSALRNVPGLAAVPADLRYWGSVWARPELTAVINLDEPLLLILAFVLQFHDAVMARRIADGYIRMLPPGSWVISTIPAGDKKLGAQITEAYTAATIFNHPPATFASFFHGLQIHGPGLVDAREWVAGGPANPVPQRPAVVLAGVGLKPVSSAGQQ